MELASVFTSAFIVAFSGAVVPGPMLTLTIGRAIEQGAAAGPLVVLGHAVLEIAVVVGMVFGLGYYLQLPAIMAVIAVAGGCVLLWMGLDMIKNWKTVVVVYDETAATGGGRDFAGSVIAGLVGSISNPYWFLWWATVGAAFIADAMQQGTLGVGVFFTGHILADLIWYSLVAVSLAAGRKWFTGAQYQWLFLCCGVAMVCLSVFFIWSGTVGNNSLGGF